MNWRCLWWNIRGIAWRASVILWLFGPERCAVCLDACAAPCKRCQRVVGVISKGHRPLLAPRSSVPADRRIRPHRFRLYCSLDRVWPQPQEKRVRKVVTAGG